MTRIRLYDWVSLICLTLGGGLGVVSVWHALQTAWMNALIFLFAAFVLWRLSSHFAQLAIASSGKQK